MDSAEIRESFLKYFESKGSVRRPSSSLIPDDPSLLLTTAGMVQFKPVFLGVTDLGSTRATTCQKCVRTTDIDIIGTTGRHHSFFEMLGNFSFGDYFKSEACAWAYEYSVSVLGLDPDRLWYSIYEDDDEARAIWRDEVGVPAERIVRMGAKDNFWAAGPTGPCGPCSELYYDQGAGVGCGLDTCAPGCDCDRFLEYWNLVFMQFDRAEDGTLTPLPKQNIDTGMGLERMASILQGVTSNYETDILRGIMTKAEELTGITYGGGGRPDTSLRILTDHARAVTFMIADGILPSNEGRGYVLRRLLRRAVRHARLLGREEPVMSTLAEAVIERMGEAYPEIVEHRELIRGITDSEEQRFGATLRQGLAFLEREVAAAQEASSAVLDGRKAFALHDTYGFPVELTSEIVAEAGMTVDMDAFTAEMEAQRERGRAAVKDESWAVSGGVFSEIAAGIGGTDFVGYETDEADATVLAVVVDGVRVERAEAGSAAEVVLDTTPFYGEQGGQVGDTGTLSVAGAPVFEVAGTALPVPGLTVHVGTVADGGIAVGDTVQAAIDQPRRERIRRNHTATHVLHWALRRVLGDHVKQSGSLVAPERLRFDFTHFEALTAEQLAKVERLANTKIMEDHPVRAYETSLASAREAGVTALFGEKYGEFVRVLEVGAFSKELCGGTHVGRTTEMGLVKIVSEGGVGANLRRIEAVTSFDAYELVLAEEAVLAETAAALKSRPAEVAEKVVALQARLKTAEQAARSSAGPRFDRDHLKLVSAEGGYPLSYGRFLNDVPADVVREEADKLRGEDGAVVLASEADGRVLLLASGSPAAVAAGFDAGAVIREMAPLVGGRGGGKPAMAQGGGDDPAGIEAALEAARALLGAE
ncbi:MAG: alanine--tRNA ligase [Coriobacteriaceae bacterium]|nr:alanine--tRNA ligase [Coriobacteriaceae bacterium]